LHEGRTDEQPVGVAQTFIGHTGFELQVPSPHVTSHAQASWQSTASHEPLPEHVTLHRPVRQRSSLHESSPLHVTVHDVAPSQSILSQELAREQVTLQLHPVGHVTLLPPSIAHVRAVASHEVHPDGQPLLPVPLATHSPVEQLRPAGQSAWVEHVYSVLRSLMVHAARSVARTRMRVDITVDLRT
jgi:hypothetical protein